MLFASFLSLSLAPMPPRMAAAPLTAAVPLTAVARVSSARSPHVIMNFNKRTMGFTALSDEKLCISAVRRLAEKIASWDDADWELFGVPALHKLTFDAAASDKIGGVVLGYHQPNYQDGALKIVLERTSAGSRLVWLSLGSRRKAYEDALYKLVLEEVRTGSLRETCRLALGLYPPSAGAASAARSVEARRNGVHATPATDKALQRTAQAASVAASMAASMAAAEELLP